MSDIPGPVFSVGNLAVALLLAGVIAGVNTLNDKEGRNAFPGKALNYFICAFVLFLPTACALFLWAAPWWRSQQGASNVWLSIFLGCLGAFAFSALARLVLIRLPLLGAQLKLYERARADKLRRQFTARRPEV